MSWSVRRVGRTKHVLSALEKDFASMGGINGRDLQLKELAEKIIYTTLGGWYDDAVSVQANVGCDSQQSSGLIIKIEPLFGLAED